MNSKAKTNEVKMHSEVAKHRGKSDGGKLPGLWVRQQAVLCLDKVIKGAAFEPFSGRLIEDSRDRALANRLVSTALVRHGHLNQVMEKLLTKGMPKRSGLFEAILRIGLTQLLFLPEMGEHSAIHLAVEMAKKDRRAGRFDRVLNGVLRQAQREAEIWQSLDNSLLFPGWLVKKWGEIYGKDALQLFGTALLEGAPLDITLKDDDLELPEALNGKKIVFDSVRVNERDCSVAQMPFFEAGRWWVQDVAAALPARLFQVPPGARVLDMCAAPGGKTAQLIKAGYQVTALDNSPGRIKRMMQNLERLNYQADVVQADATNFCPEEKFDAVLVDAPCTATGTFRRHPEVIWNRSEADIASRVALQRAIISNGVKCLKKGGELILCVCSLHPEEGEEQANWVLHKFPHLRSIDIVADEIGGLKGAIGPDGRVRTHPGIIAPGMGFAGMDGFFVARWRLE